MSFTYNTAVPAANDNPSNDQPDMLTNTQSINSIWAIDHVTFQGNPAGTHLQTTFSSKNTPGAQTDPQSISFTADSSTLAPTIGSASTIAEQFLRNQNGFFPTSCIKAFCVFTAPAANGAVVPSNSFNVGTVVRSGALTAPVYTITLTTNATIGNNICSLICIDTGLSFTNLKYTSSFVGGVLTINFTNNGFNVTNPYNVNICILQI